MYFRKKIKISINNISINGNTIELGLIGHVEVSTTSHKKEGKHTSVKFTYLKKNSN